MDTVHPGGTVITRLTDGDIRWWTWAGHRANAMLAASLPSVAAPQRRFEDHWIRLCDDLTPTRWKAAVTEATLRLCLPEVDERAVRGLKFSEALPARLAEATLAARSADEGGARAVLTEPVRLTTLNRP
ncbi:hypothetical protein [Streptomyces coeruleorubidus]|nr:hypothetical protein [Streptomyces coeruleorubidus]GGT50106.1 hypothetical protein GCM10010256_03030 [Streptomyces coeruleorubidus]